MAWTTTKLAQYAVGNYYHQQWALSADSGTLELSTGLKDCIAAYAQPISFASTVANIKVDVLSAGTASQGTVAITGVTSGDELYLTVIGV